MTLIPAISLAILGLFQLYVSAIFVEKYYTAFWIAVWNIYGTVLTFVGLVLEAAGIGNVTFIIFAFIVMGLSLVSLACGGEGYPEVTRTVGASILMTSTGLAGVALLACPNLIYAGVAFVANFLIVLSMKCAVIYQTSRSSEDADLAVAAFACGIVLMPVSVIAALICISIPGLVVNLIGVIVTEVTLGLLILGALIVFSD